MRGTALLGLAILLAACTTARVHPIDPSVHIDRVCIHANPRVEVADFLAVLQAEFTHHGIATEVYSEAPPESCEYILEYEARRSWDGVTSLAHAELYLLRAGKTVGSAAFDLRGKAGYSLLKAHDPENLMNPVIDRLLGVE
jgi:hypothetical protein